jgi:hypothetical protein
MDPNYLFASLPYEYWGSRLSAVGVKVVKAAIASDLDLFSFLVTRLILIILIVVA